MLMCSLHHSPSDQVQNGCICKKYCVFARARGPLLIVFLSSFVNILSIRVVEQLVVLLGLSIKGDMPNVYITVFCLG